MSWKTCLTALALLVLTACLEREYENPFLSEGDPGLGEEWKRDLDGNGISDSVEFYARDCHAAPAECLRRAKEASLIAKGQVPPADTVVAPDTANTGNPPQDTLGDTPPPEDTLPVIIPPQDTVRDTVVVPPQVMAVTGIEASPIYIPMGVAKATPSVRVLPRNADNQGYTLASLDQTVVKVSGTDLIPVKPGSAKVRARSEDGGFTLEFTATVVVEDTNTYETAVAVARMDMTAGDPPQAPDITWTPATVSNRGYSLASSDPAIVRVVSEGGLQKCMPVAAGKAILTLITAGKGLKAEFEVTVKTRPILTFPVLAISADDMVLDLGGANQVPDVSITPALATRKAYTLSSNEPSIVSVSGTALHAVSKGKATITITSVDGPSGTFTATVRVRVASVSASDLALASGERADPVVSFSPPDADDQRFTLTSGDESIVRIRENTVIGRRSGKTVISIVALDGNKTGSFTVTVTNRGGIGDNDEEESEDDQIPIGSFR